MFTDFSTSFTKKIIAVAVFVYEDLIRCFLISCVVFTICLYFSDTFSVIDEILPISVVGVALSIFLSFKSKAAYDRWWEARKIWGEIINDSRTFSMQVITYISDKHLKGSENNSIQARQKELLYRHIAWINALRYYLRNEYYKFDNISPFLSKEELEKLIN